ncbi:MAG TPA: hypothetical protein VMV12_06270 [Candidatus Micrarchaeaceae archaeon]|nr:hypothetical protein [Candidatus Micrarchaeaceae archaeon]
MAEGWGLFAAPVRPFGSARAGKSLEDRVAGLGLIIESQAPLRAALFSIATGLRQRWSQPRFLAALVTTPR